MGRKNSNVRSRNLSRAAQRTRGGRKPRRTEQPYEPPPLRPALRRTPRAV